MASQQKPKVAPRHERVVRDVIVMMTNEGIVTSRVTPREAIEYCKNKMPLSSYARQWWVDTHVPTVKEKAVKDFERYWREQHRKKESSDVGWNLGQEEKVLTVGSDTAVGSASAGGLLQNVQKDKIVR